MRISNASKMRQHTLSSSSSVSEKSSKGKPSILLSTEENDHVFSLLGRKCQTQCTAVVQLYMTETPAHSCWVKKHTGALCFIKDSAKRSYYFRLYCLMRNELVWEQEMYDTIAITKPRPYLLTFEGQEGIVALNFASDEEAETFSNTATTTVANRNRRREERRGRIRKDPPARPPAINKTSQNNNNRINRNDSDHDMSVTIRNPQRLLNAQPSMPNNNMTAAQPPRVDIRNKNKQVRRIRKEDIGSPSNFKHITHVGWSPQSGFDLSGEEETLKPFLEKAGVSDQQLRDRETREFIYDFIANHKVVDTVKSERLAQPPPVPHRQPLKNGNSQRIAPPPPPTRQQPAIPPPLPPTTPPSRVINNIGPPSRPPPIQASAPPPTAPGPPPPPPPPMFGPPPPVNLGNVIKSPTPSQGAASSKGGGGGGEDTRSALLDSIRKGTQLKKVEPPSSAQSTGSEGDTRNDLLSEIRHGIELRPLSQRELNPASNRSSDTGTDALADALRRALAERGRVIRSSDEDSDASSDNDGEWDD